MENKELFKNAKFGDKFKTRDGRCAIYDFYDKDDIYGHQMLVENCGITYYNNDGRYDEDEEDELDIVSRWEEGNFEVGMELNVKNLKLLLNNSSDKSTIYINGKEYVIMDAQDDTLDHFYLELKKKTNSFQF